MTDLVARAVFTGDSAGLVASATQAEAGLTKVGAAAKSASADGKSLAGTYDAVSVALQGQAKASSLAADAAAGAAKGSLALADALRDVVAEGAEAATAVAALVGAQNAYNASVNQARAALAQGTISQEAYEASVEAAAASLAVATVAQDENVRSLLAARAAQDDLTGRAAALRAQIDPLGAAQVKLNTSMAEADALLKAGKISETEHTAAVLLAKQAYTDTEKAITSGTESAVHLESELAHVGERFGVSRADALGFRAALDIIAENPALAALIALGVAGVGLAYVGTLIEAANDKIATAITLTGNAAGLTQDKIDSLTKDVQNAAQVSDLSAKAMVASFIQNKIDPQLWTTVADAARGYAVVVGKDIPEAAAELADKLHGGTQGLQDLQKVLGNLPAPIAATAEQLFESGHNADAMRLILAQLKPELDDVSTHVTTASGIWGAFSNAISGSVTALDEWLEKKAKADGHSYDLMEGEHAGMTDAQVDQLTGWSDTSAPTDGLLAHAQAYQSGIKDLINDATTLKKTLDPFPAQLEQLSAEQQKYDDALKQGGLTVDQQKTLETTLSDIQTKRAQVLKAQRDAQLNLNDAEKAHEELVKRLVLTEGPQAVSQATDQATAYEKEAAAAFDSTYAQRDLQQEFEIQKATLPYVTALQYAHGVAADKLRAIIDNLTAALKRQHTAQNDLSGVQDITQSFSGLSDLQTYDPKTDTTATPKAIQSESNMIATVQLQATNSWYDNDKAALDDWYEKNKTTVANAQDLYEKYQVFLTDVFNNKIAKVYSDDWARRTDWEAGAERGYEGLTKDTANWAKTSQQLTTDASQKTEDDFIAMINGSKTALSDYVNFWVTEFEKLLYQRYLAQSVNGLLNQGISLIGSALGLGGGNDGPVSSAVAAGIGSAVTAETHHAGGVAGDGAALRVVHPAYFGDAPRFHSGVRGVGLGSDEIPAILQRGESVYTAKQSRAIDDMMSLPVEVHVAQPAPPQFNWNVKTDPNVSVQHGPQTPNSSGGFDQEFIIRMIDQNLALANHQGRSALTKSLEATHGLKRGSS